MNPIFQSTVGKGMTDLSRMAGGDPMALLAQMAQSNPQARMILDAISRGSDPERLFRDMCRQSGVDADSFLRQLGYKR